MPLVNMFSNFLFQLLKISEPFDINKQCAQLADSAPCCSDLKGTKIITTTDLTQATRYRKTNCEHYRDAFSSS